MPVSVAILDFDASGSNHWFRNYVDPAAIVEWVDGDFGGTRLGLPDMISVTSPKTVFLSADDQRVMHQALIASGKVRQVIGL